MISGLRVPVNLTSRQSLRMFHLADIWAARTGHEVRLVSANDHVHTRESAHYEGRAVDFQSSDMDNLAATFRAAGYRVLWKVRGHFGHVHVEDPQASARASRADRTSNGPRQAMATRPRPARIGG